MSAVHNKSRRQLPMRLVRTQAAVASLIVVIWLVFLGYEAAVAALFGGLIGVVTNLYFATRSFALGPGATAQQMLQAMFRAEMVKLLLSALLFALAAKFFSEHFLALFSAWFATTAVYFIALRWV